MTSAGGGRTAGASTDASTDAMRWRMLAVCSLARLAMGFQFQSIASMNAPLRTAYGFSATEIGLLIGLYLIPGIAFALPGGLLGSRFGDRRVAVFGLLVMTLGSMATVLHDGPATFYAARLASGIGAVLFNVIVTKMVADWFHDRELVLSLSVLINAWPLGMILSLMLVATLAPEHAVRLGNLQQLIASVASLALFATFYRSRSVGADTTPTVERAGIPVPARAPLGFASLAWMFYNVAYTLFVSYAAPFLMAGGASRHTAALLPSLASAASIVAIQVGGLLAQRFGIDRLVAYVGLAGCLLGLLLLLAGAPPLASVVLLGFAGGLPAAPLMAAPAKVLDTDNRSVGMGWFYTVYYAGMCLFPPIAGRLSGNGQHAAAPLWLASAALVATAGCLPLAKPRPAAAQAGQAGGNPRDGLMPRRSGPGS